MSEIKPVLIVGAGPTGMTAAIELTRFGIPVRIIDKLREPSTTSRALAVQARTLELFGQRGLTEEMLRLGNQGNAVTIYGDGKPLGKVHLSEIPSRYNFILLLSQAETERLLREQLVRQGVVIERGTELIAFAQPESVPQPGQSGGVTAVLRDRDGNLEELAASYLVSAEGAHSTVRHTLSLEFSGRSLGQSYALADLYLDGDIPDDELSIFLSEHAFLAVFPMGNRHFRFIATDPEKHARADAPPTLEELQKICDAVHSIPVRLRDMTWSSRFVINSRMLHTLRAGRIFFAGDAAHIHSPAGGQGMNTGIQDMINLSWKMALSLRGKAAPELLDTYGEDRLPVIRSVVSKTEAATDAFNSDSPLVHQLMTHILPVMLHRQFVQHLGTGLISEVATNYRGSGLSQTQHAPGELQGGDRVPDLDVVVGDGGLATHLYELLDPSRLTLLVTQEESGISEEENLALWDDLLQTYRIQAPADPPEAKAEFKRCFGVRPGLFLVRPDSYLGFVGDSNSGPTLREWLNRWLPPAPG